MGSSGLPLRRQLDAWFGKAAYPLVAFDKRTSRVVYANSAAEELLSLPLINPIGLSLRELSAHGEAKGKTLDQESFYPGKIMRMTLNPGLENERIFDFKGGGEWPGDDGLGIGVFNDVTEAVQTEKALEYRKRMETLLLSLSTHFLNLHGEKVDSGINYALRSLGTFAGADRSHIFQFLEDAKLVQKTHHWRAKGIPAMPENFNTVPSGHFTWFEGQLRSLKTVHVPSIASLPDSAEQEKKYLAAEGIQNLLLIPMEHRGVLKGFLSFVSGNPAHVWSDDIVSLLRIAGELLINALERKATDQALNAISRRYQGLFENAVEGIFQTRMDGQFIAVNPALANILGFGHPDELLGSEHNTVTHFYQDIAKRHEFIDALELHDKILDFEVRIKKIDGSLIWLSINARSVRDADGRLQFIEGSAMDITQRKAMEDQLMHDALHDALTGLPNRALLLERLGRSIDRLRRRTSLGSCVLLLDLDRFKNLNDGMGHSQGDRLLVAVAARIESLLPPGATLARLGGDEFGILLEDVEGHEAAIELATAAQRQFELPFAVGTEEVYASVSIGISRSMPHSLGDDVLRDADIAMHQAKHDGRARYSVFDASMHTRALERLHIENDLRKALERKEFFLVYQPIVELGQGKLMGFEALIRWRHPLRGIVPPVEFIPVAEENGFIVPLGLWVLEEACRQLFEWHALLTSDKPLTMSVNISGKQFEGMVLAAQIEGICRAAGVHPRYLKLEVTESALISNPDVAAAVLKDLKNKGFQLSLDDFGTGYSSLSYLHRFPFHNLKIDRSFVMKLEEDVKNDEIVKAINYMAKNLGMDVTAEGVETQGQWDRLKLLETPFGQGFFFSKPLSAEAATDWIRLMLKPGD